MEISDQSLDLYRQVDKNVGMNLDAASPVPLYHQLQEILRAQIGQKVFKVGAKIPSEHELCRNYGVTRPTVRQALEGLVREGLIAKHRGKGAFVSAPPAPVGLFSVAGTSESFAARKMLVKTQLLRSSVEAVCQLADGADPGGGWVKLERLRSINAIPTFYEYTWIHASLVRGLERLDLNDRSLYKTLTEHFGLRIEGGRQRFSAVAAPLEIARSFHVRPGAPILRVVRSMDLARQFSMSTPASAPRLSGALRVDLYCAQGPFVLEQAIPARATSSAADLNAVSYLTPAAAAANALKVANQGMMKR
jgi:GntR family transcriptional regulator